MLEAALIGLLVLIVILCFVGSHDNHNTPAI
jgi:hypothetical protein